MSWTPVRAGELSFDHIGAPLDGGNYIYVIERISMSNEEFCVTVECSLNDYENVTLSLPPNVLVQIGSDEEDVDNDSDD